MTEATDLRAISDLVPSGELVDPSEPVSASLNIKLFLDEELNWHRVAWDYSERFVNCVSCGLVATCGIGDLVVTLASGAKKQATCCLKCANHVSEVLDRARNDRR